MKEKEAEDKETIIYPSTKSFLNITILRMFRLEQSVSVWAVVSVRGS